MHRDSVKGELITPVPLLPSNSAVVRQLVDDLSAFYDDGSGVLQQMVARIPLFFDIMRAYVARISADAARFTVTQASGGVGSDLLGYTQSVARLPAYVRGALRTGVQGNIQDAKTFPLTPQQRRMIWYEGVGATVVTPIPARDGTAAGALIVDSASERKWEPATLEALRMLAEAIGARWALASLGDHLVTDDGEPDPAAMRLNVLANAIEQLETASDPPEASDRIAGALAQLPFVASARFLAGATGEGLKLEALANERMTVREHRGTTTVMLPLVLEGERFGAIEIALVEADARLSAADEQFLRMVMSLASRVFASALRRRRPRSEALSDAITGLPNYRAVHEGLVEGVHAARLGNRPLAIWLLDIEGLDEINRNHGYAVGDDCVGFIGHSLSAAIAPRGSAGRVRGGSFMCVFPGSSADEAAVSAKILVERLLKGTPGHLPPIALRVGVAAYPAHAASHDELIRYARLALFAAKREGRNHVVTANPGDERWVREARAAFVQIVTEQETPIGARGRQTNP